MPIPVGGTGLGYNPYRNHGKFAPGPHKAKAKPKVGRQAAAVVVKPVVAKPKKAAVKTPRPKKAKFDDTAHKAKIAEHKKIEAHHRTESLKIVAKQRALREQAKGLHKSDKAGRADLKAQHKALGEKRGEHKAAATKARTDRIATSKDLQAAKKRHVVEQATGHAAPASAPKKTATPEQSAHAPGKDNVAPATSHTPDSIHKLVASDAKRKDMLDQEYLPHDPRSDPNGFMHRVQFTAKAQAAIRDHHNEVFAAYGMHNLDKGKSEAKKFEIRTEAGMGGDSLGVHWTKTGKIAVSQSQAAELTDHARLDSHGLKKLGQDYMAGGQRAHDTLDAYITSTHEALHGHGPQIGNGKARTMINELTTEIAACKVAADIHGLHPHDIEGSYRNYINPTVDKLAQLSGKSHRDATAALADASVKLKQRSDTDLSPVIAIHDVAGHALKQLGVTDVRKHDDLTKHMIDLAHSE